jgi:hypothetical protein
MFRRRCFDEAGGFRERCVPGEDWDLWLRIAVRNDVVCDSHTLVRYRIHESSITAGSSLNDYSESHERILRAFFEEGAGEWYASLRDYGYASHWRTLARLAAWNREPAAWRRYLAKAVRAYPQIAFEAETWDCLASGVKSLLPAGVVRFAGSIRKGLRQPRAAD